jgi:hypothetical protein
MKLSEFVRTTIEEIVFGIKGSHEAIGQQGGAILTSQQKVEFDIAVTVVEGGETKTGGEIRVWGFKAGSEGHNSGSNTTVSRVKFEVPLTIPGTIGRSAPIASGSR